MIGKLASVGSRAVTLGLPGPFPVGRPPTALRHADLNNDSSSRAINDYCKLPIRCPRLLLALGLRIIYRKRRIDWTDQLLFPVLLTARSDLSLSLSLRVIEIL